MPAPDTPRDRGPLDEDEARLREELKQLKDRWLADREEEVSYFKAAALNQYNLITLVGLGALAAVSGVLAPLFLSAAVAWEVAWLGIAPSSARFRRSVRARRSAEALARREVRRVDLLRALPLELRARHESAALIAREIRRHAEAAQEGEADLLDETVAKLDFLLEEYARLLLAQHRTVELLRSGEAATVQTRARALEAELGSADPPGAGGSAAGGRDQDLAQRAQRATEGDRLRAAKQRSLDVLRQRLERLSRSREDKEYLDLRLETVENTLKLVRDRVIAATTAQGIATGLDDVLLELGRHRETLRTVEDSLDERVPAADEAAAPERAAAERAAGPPPALDGADTGAFERQERSRAGRTGEQP